MIYWIKRLARILGIVSFFCVFFVSVDPTDPFNVSNALIASMKGLTGAFLFWGAGFVIADIIIKGLVTDLRTEGNDILEGGLLQRIHATKETLSPDTNSGEDNASPKTPSALKGSSVMNKTE
jgi:hypothetical protein